MEDQQYKALFGELKSIKEEVQATRDEIARVDRDLCKDREDLENFRVSLSNVVDEIKSLKSMVTKNVDNVGDKVTDALKPAVKEVTSLKQEIKKKKTITIFKTGIMDHIKNLFIVKEIKKEIQGGE